METIQVDGVSITLTKEQTDHIKKVKAERRKILNTAAKTLKHFGFKGIGDLCYTNDKKGWYAEIYDCGGVWITGEGLPNNGFPGGSMYDNPKEIINELEKHV